LNVVQAVANAYADGPWLLSCSWEGGTRVAALVNGGFLPEHQRGKKLEEPLHEADW
jgi:hypothetical protein